MKKTRTSNPQRKKDKYIMNKNITKSILALMACSAAFCACSREEADLFDKSAADRLNEVSEVYTHRLAADGGEWVMEYFPTNYSDSITSPYSARSKGYLLLNKFDANGSVRVGMKNALSGNKYMEDVSAWEVITDLGPVLTYNTYNECVHTFSDPQNPAGISGTGVGGDYEFVITHLEADAQQTMLKGKKRGSYTRMSRLPQGTNFEEYFADIDEFATNHFPGDMPNDLVMEVSGKQYYVRSLSTGIACIFPVGSSWADSKTYHPFVFSKQADGKYYLRFREAFEGLNESENAQEFCWDDENYCFVDVDNSANIIRGLDAADIAAFYNHAMSLNGWRFSDDIGPDAKAIYDNFLAGLTKKSSQNTMQNITVGLYQDVSDPDHVKDWMQVDIYYMQGRNTRRHLIYLYKTSVQDGKFVATFDGPKDKFSTDNQNSIEGLQQLIDMFAGSFDVAAPKGAGFLINKAVLTSTSNPNLWFRMNYINAN